MTPEIKDEWFTKARKAYKRIDAFVDDDALRRALEAIAPAIYEAGLRAGLEAAGTLTRAEARRVQEILDNPPAPTEAAREAMRASMRLLNPPEPAGDQETGGDDGGHGELRD